MKRTYTAPVSEYMTFTVDEVIAANCNVKPDTKNFAYGHGCHDFKVTGFAVFSGESCVMNEITMEIDCYYTGSGRNMFTS